MSLATARRVPRAAVALLACGLAAAPCTGVAQTSSQGVPAVAPVDCAIVAGAELDRIAGAVLAPPDEASRSAGICFSAARAASDDVSASYAVVTADRLAERRGFFAVQARRCGSAVKGTSNYAPCRTYVALAQAADLDAYYRARTGGDDARAIDADLGAPGVATPQAIFTRRGAAVFEVAVRRGEELDVARSLELAKLLLARAR